MIDQLIAEAALRHLSDLLKRRNYIDHQIAALIDRPASIGHLGEYVASAVFDIVLAESAVTKGHDGYFRSGPLAGRTVNVKWYGKLENSLDINAVAPADYYLVLAGPRATSASSRGGTRPLVIESVHLFAGHDLLTFLRERGVKIGVATSVPQSQWTEAEVYPSQKNPVLLLTHEQRALLNLFKGEDVSD